MGLWAARCECGGFLQLWDRRVDVVHLEDDLSQRQARCEVIRRKLRRFICSDPRFRRVPAFDELEGDLKPRRYMGRRDFDLPTEILEGTIGILGQKEHAA